MSIVNLYCFLVKTVCMFFLVAFFKNLIDIFILYDKITYCVAKY